MRGHEGGLMKGTTSRKGEKQLLVALDIGTSKVAAVVGDINPQGGIEVVGVGTQTSRGLKRGMVVNIESTVQSIQRAVQEAELMAGCQIHSVVAGIAGSHIRSLNSHGIVAVKDREVTPDDVDRVLDAARAITIPADQRILHVLPQEYRVDDQDGIREPVGMFGVRLEARVHLVTGAIAAVQNIEKCIQRCGLVMDDVVLQPLASSLAVLSDDEKELGVALIDIGGGTTDLAVFMDGAICFTEVIPVAGDHVTSDIAITLRTPTPHAEQIKIQHARALRELADPQRSVEVPGVGDRPPRQLSQQVLSEVVEKRLEEIFELCREALMRSGLYERLAGGVVLTGGASRLAGTADLAEGVLDLPVRLGVPGNVGGMSEITTGPQFATAAGLLLYATRKSQMDGLSRSSTGEMQEGLLQRMRRWFTESF